MKRARKAILVINSGSSSIKYQFFEIGTYAVLARGCVEKIGESKGKLRHSWLNAADENKEIQESHSVSNHRHGFDWILDKSVRFFSGDNTLEICGIGHRVVHGGEVFTEPTLVDERVVEAVREMIPLAPLHNPANLIGIEVMLERWPDVPQAAVFDTSFHHTMPSHAFHYAIPLELYEDYHVRRYGFHGTSHSYVFRKAAEYLDRSSDSLNLITLHLGNGASATAIKEGKSIDTSMGMTPMEGLIMGTRCGDIDPAIVFYLGRAMGKTNEELERMLNNESGLKGISGENDMREIIRLASQGEAHAQLAIEMYCYRIRKYVGSYFAILGRVDALVFTGGIGENAAMIRKLCCKNLESLGINLDDQRNEAVNRDSPEIQGEESAVKVLVVPTNEELEIAHLTHKLISDKGRIT